MKPYLQALALISAIFVSTPVHAELDHISPEDLNVGRASANKLFLKRDIPGLMQLLKESHLFIQQDVALKLGMLGAKEAVEELRKLDKSCANFACAASGQFGVAVILIENPKRVHQRAALLEVATESKERQIHAHSVIDQAGWELSRFEGEDIQDRLARINTYGAQFTVLELQCRKLSIPDAIAKCVEVLELHETPQKAEAAQALLISTGKSATAPVLALKARTEATDPTFTLPKTIVGRCESILQAISRGEQQDGGAQTATRRDSKSK